MVGMKINYSFGKCAHSAKKPILPVRVGNVTIYAGAVEYFYGRKLYNEYDVLVPLERGISPFDSVVPNIKFGTICLWAAMSEDRTPSGWQRFLSEKLVFYLENRKRVLAYCYNGHGQTGMLIGSLISTFESKIMTPDPIAETRLRYCPHAIQTLLQAETVFAVRGEALPDKYVEEFVKKSA